MSEPYIGEISLLPFPWAPVGWHICDGSLLPVQQNQALFSLIGKTFGGDGVNNFALPDLRGRTPVGPDPLGTHDPNNKYQQGSKGGLETVTLTAASTPAHAHTVAATTANGDQLLVAGHDFATAVNSVSGSPIAFKIYQPNAGSIPNPAVLAAQTVSTVGGGQAHNNMQPYTVVNFCIATEGYYPQRP